MLTIANLTFKEALRKKILVAALILTVLFLALYGVGLYYATGSMQESASSAQGAPGDAFGANAQTMVDMTKRLLVLLGIYFASKIVSLLAIFSSVGAVSSEVENGMLHAILAKPVRRRDIILGKFLGFAGMLTVYSALLFLIVLVLNYYIAGTGLSDVPALTALFIIQPLVFLAVTIAGSTTLSTLANGIAAFTLYILGSVGGMVEQIGAMINNTALVNTGIVSSLIMPADAIYRMIAAILSKSPGGAFDAMFFGPFGAVSAPSNAMIVYSVLYIFAFAGIAVAAFSRKDIG